MNADQDRSEGPAIYRYYHSPLGAILLAGNSRGLTGLWFEKSKYFAEGLDPESREGNSPVLEETARWLDVYFSGKEPGFMPQIRLSGSPFRMEVWALLREIPYGKTVTYGEIAKKLAARRGLSRMSAQAVGGAVGRNPVSILVPCHRVVGSTGSLTGYAGGVDKKKALLLLEGAVIGGKRF